MSSEDSTHDEGEDNDSIVVHPLPWRAESVSNMFHKIDKFNNDRKSNHAKRMQKKRIDGSFSERQPPQDESLGWAIHVHQWYAYMSSPTYICLCFQV